MNSRILIPLLISGILLNGLRAQDIQGTLTDPDPAYVGAFDYFIDVSADTLVISNPTGEYANFFAFESGPVLLRSHDDFTQSAGDLALLQAATYDFTGAEASPLGMASGDGFFWVSDTTVQAGGSAKAQIALGGTLGLSGPSTDLPVLAFLRLYVNGARTFTTFGLSDVNESSTTIPEPSSALLCLISSLAILKRRR